MASSSNSREDETTFANYNRFIELVEQKVNSLAGSSATDTKKRPPQYDTEYKRAYASDESGTEQLTECIASLNRVMREKLNAFDFPLVRMFVNMKRWRENSQQLDEFLESARNRPGSIFKEKRKEAFRSSDPRVQNFSNVPKGQLKLGVGRTR